MGDWRLFIAVSVDEPFVCSLIGMMFFIAFPSGDEVVEIEKFFSHGILHVEITASAICGNVLFDTDLFAGQLFGFRLLPQALQGGKIRKFDDDGVFTSANNQHESTSMSHSDNLCQEQLKRLLVSFPLKNYTM